MNFTQLDQDFNTVFTKISTSLTTMHGGKQPIASGVVMEVKPTNGPKGRGFTLSFTLTYNGGTTKRSKTFGPYPKPEIPWDMAAVSDFLLDKMDAVFSALPVETQSAFATHYVAVKDFVRRGRHDVAKQIVENATITSDLQKTKDAILAYLS